MPSAFRFLPEKTTWKRLLSGVLQRQDGELTFIEHWLKDVPLGEEGTCLVKVMSFLSLTPVTDMAN